MRREFSTVEWTCDRCGAVQVVQGYRPQAPADWQTVAVHGCGMTGYTRHDDICPRCAAPAVGEMPEKRPIGAEWPPDVRERLANELKPAIEKPPLDVIRRACEDGSECYLEDALTQVFGRRYVVGAGFLPAAEELK